MELNIWISAPWWTLMRFWSMRTAVFSTSIPYRNKTSWSETKDMLLTHPFMLYECFLFIPHLLSINMSQLVSIILIIAWASYLEAHCNHCHWYCPQNHQARHRTYNRILSYTVKKSFSIFPFPVGMSLTKLSPGGNYDIIYKLFLPWENLVSDIPAGDGNIEKLFLRCSTQICWYAHWRLPTKWKHWKRYFISRNKRMKKRFVMEAYFKSWPVYSETLE